MSSCSYDTAIVRLHRPDSPLAVYRVNDSDSIGVVFAETAWTAAKIRRGWPELVGVYDNTSDIRTVKAVIRQIIGEKNDAS